MPPYQHLKVLAKPSRQTGYTDIIIISQSHFAGEFGGKREGDEDFNARESCWPDEDALCKLGADDGSPALDIFSGDHLWTLYVRGTAVSHATNLSTVSIPNKLWLEVKVVIEAYNAHFNGEE